MCSPPPFFTNWPAYAATQNYQLMRHLIIMPNSQHFITTVLLAGDILHGGEAMFLNLEIISILSLHLIPVILIIKPMTNYTNFFSLKSVFLNIESLKSVSYF